MEKMEQSPNDLIFVVGRTASGKTVLARHLTSLFGRNYQYIETSDVIREFVGKRNRSALAFNPDLDQAVVQRIKELLAKGNVIVGGTRQWSIIEPFESFAKIIWLSVPAEMREMMFTTRADSDDDVTLASVDKRDDDLGLPSILHNIMKRELR